MKSTRNGNLFGFFNGGFNALQGKGFGTFATAGERNSPRAREI
jgi:hypothetical protein